MTDREPGWLRRLCEAALDRCERRESDLRFYQAEIAVPFMLANPKSAAYLDMGLGKTASVLTVLDDCFSRNTINKALIIAPVRVAVQTWPTEIGKWRHTAWMEDDYSLIRPDPDDEKVTFAMQEARARERLEPMGSPNHAAGRARTAMFEQQKRDKANSPARIHIINREAVEWLVRYFGRKWPYDCIIVDESTSFADHTSARFKALARVTQLATRIHLLSGTPAPEGIQDLFAQIYLLDKGERFGRGITHFRKQYMMQHPYTKKWMPQMGAIATVTAKINDIALVMKQEDYLPDLKGSLVIERPIILEPKLLKQYRAFKSEMILQLPDGVEIEAVNAGVLAGKLLQWCSGAVYDENRVVHHIHDHKIEEMKELAEELRGTPLMIAYWFKSSLAVLRKAFPKGTPMDKEGKCVDDWNKGKIPYMFVHPASAGHGLNMQLGPGNTLIYFDTPASLEMYLQLNKRLDRPGQAALVRIFHLTVQKTEEQYSVAKLKLKENGQDEITRRLRIAQKSLLRAS